MNKPTVRKTYLKILALLSCPFILSGCSNQSECTETSDHAHRYVNPKTGIELHIGNSEYLTYNGYIWQEDFYTLNEDDVAFYEQKKDLFYGPDNWDYLYNVMASKEDYLEFYYEYTTDDTITMVDADGNVSVFPSTTTHTGWTRDPKYSHNTGKVHLCHNKFFGYRIVYKDGKYDKEQSPYADDFREIIDDYPYFDTKCSEVVSKDYTYSVKDLPNLKVSDFNDFKKPDLNNRELNNNTK